MEMRELAERVLFGRTLEDKLLRPERVTDLAPGPAIARPTHPGRPPGLAPVRRARLGFPSVAHLERPEVRADMLHRFANHELLAIELMALALLRFPDAPAAFRRGLHGAMLEEQLHFELYRERLEACGGELGAVPASPLFWDMLSPMSDPLDFVVGMSLTFEQANLDYAGHYRDAFTTIGDHETAAVLDRVYEDEIGHVKLGLVWFRKWLDPQDDWVAYRDALPDRLQPSRAKGIGFDADARRRAGFDEAWISRLRLFAQSRGRVPALHWFDPSAELELAGAPIPAVVRQLTRDFETLPMFLCARDDVVCVERLPRSAFLEPLARAGFAVPEFITADMVADRRFSALRPWAAVPSASVHGPVPTTPSAVFGKDWSAGLLAALYAEGVIDGTNGIFDASDAIVGQVCHDTDAVNHAIDAIERVGGVAVLKAAFGTAGQAMQIVRGTTPRKWIARTVRSGPIVVEPWLDRVLDLGVQLTVGDRVEVDAITRNLVDGRGRFRGVALVKLGAGLPIELRRWLLGGDVLERLRAVAVRAGHALADVGHRGWAGIDAMVYRTAEGFRLKPIVEINPRCTMGRVALRLRPRIARGAHAAWLQVAAEDGPSRAEIKGDPPVLTDAALWTTDPAGARFATLLLVAPTFEMLRDRVARRVTAVDPGFTPAR